LDEVLSVGDEGFRLKCQELLKKFTLSGNTIVFVSHNRIEVMELSNKCIWLENGRIKKMGAPNELLAEYFARHKDNFDGKKEIVEIPNTLNKTGTIDLQWDEESAPQNEMVAIRSLSLFSDKATEKLFSSIPISLRVLLDKKIANVKVGVFFFVQDIFYQSVMVGNFLHNTMGNDISKSSENYTGLLQIECSIPADFLMPGKYYLQLRFGCEEKEWNTLSRELLRFSEKLQFEIYADENYIEYIGDLSKGAVRPRLEWKSKLL